MDIGNFPKRVLLTGAGWSRNWGGYLASEIWDSLISAVHNNERLRNLLLVEPSFEAALAKTREQFVASDHEQLEQAVFAAFSSMDLAMRPRNRAVSPNINKVQEMLFRFFGQRMNGVDTGYIFTLNQDLFFEYYLYNQHFDSRLCPILPGIQGRPNVLLFPFEPDLHENDLTFHTSENDRLLRSPQGSLHVIKLHGSFNWRTKVDGRNIMVIGTKKSAQIAQIPLLAWYVEIFQRVLASGDVRLMIMGYSFGDEHINDAIAEAVEHHGLKVFIWNIDANLRERVLSARRGDAIWNGVYGKTTRNMLEIFPVGQTQTEEYRSLQDAFMQ